ncbi:hypothetical protein I4F81_011562 [Pyropia yezoensis]|uniref:Uncharacterized protein n=1 Tax=Pyropia yezoensis TaxID=2788 RepID=A0ACC3CG65_PYRYE|nr:hypothetical protein I4F81_011562 [Neopyropia yezoensis]
MDMLTGLATLAAGTTAAAGWAVAVTAGGGTRLPPAARVAVWAPAAVPVLAAAAGRSFDPAADAALALTAAALCLWWVPMRTASALTGYGPGAESSSTGAAAAAAAVGRGVWLAAHAALAAGGATAVTSVATAAAAAAGFAVHPPFGAPLPPASLAAFWGAQWNRPVSQLLRHGVYEPVRDVLRGAVAARLPRRGTGGRRRVASPAGGTGSDGGDGDGGGAAGVTRRAAMWAAAPAAVGVVAAFVVSGVAHEAILGGTAAD